MSDAPPVASIVIVTYGQRALTEACLRSLDRALGPELGRSFEIVVVDNDSPDDTVAMLSTWADRVTVLAQAANRNFAGGCNIGARASRGEILIFLNNDTIVGAGVLEGLVETVREPGVGAAGLRLLYPDGGLQHAGFLLVVNPNESAIPLPGHLLYRHDGDHPAGRATYELDAVTGACLAVGRDVFDEVGGFDEGFVNGCEDVDLCFKVRATGRSIVYRGDLTVEHHEGGTRGAGIDDRINMGRLHARWGAMLEQDDELAARNWDATLTEPADQRLLPSRDIAVVGEITGIGPAADEARGLILALERAGRPAVGVDLTPVKLRPVLSGDTGRATIEAVCRAAPAGPALRIDVPFGAASAAQAPPGAGVRARHVSPDGRTAGVIPAAPAGEAAWIAPAIDVAGPVGPGGAGLLVSLPAPDTPACQAILDALAHSEVRGLPIRLVPTVVARGLAERVAATLPSAELLAPCSDEARWIALAATADVAVCLDADDRFERRALGAAGAGATVVVAVPDGPAGAILGEQAVVAGPDGLAAVLPAAVAAAPSGRAAVAACARAACAPERVGRQLLALVGQGLS